MSFQIPEHAQADPVDIDDIRRIRHRYFWPGSFKART